MKSFRWMVAGALAATLAGGAPPAVSADDDGCDARIVSRCRKVSVERVVDRTVVHTRVVIPHDVMAGNGVESAETRATLRRAGRTVGRAIGQAIGRTVGRVLGRDGRSNHVKTDLLFDLREVEGSV
jgi:hypothetical protein